MASKRANVAQLSLKASLSSLGSSNQIFCRAIGQHEGVTHLDIVDVGENGLKTLFRVEVIETQQMVIVRHPASSIVLTAFGGLQNVEERMRVISPWANKPLGFVDSEFLQYENEHNGKVLFGWHVDGWLPDGQKYTFTLAEAAKIYRSDCSFNIVLNLESLSEQQRFRAQTKSYTAAVYSTKKSAATVVDFPAADYNNVEMKAVLMMSAIKMYYNVWLFQRCPMTSKIPSLIDVREERPASLKRQLESLSNLLLRPAFTNPSKGEAFAELIDTNTGQPIFVVVYKQECTKIYDVTGREVFFIKIGEDLMRTEIYSRNQCVGSFSNDDRNFQDEIKQHMYRITAKEEEGCSSFWLDGELNVVNIEFQQSLNSRLKATTLAHAVTIANNGYECFRDVLLPEIPYYLFRPV